MLSESFGKKVNFSTFSIAQRKPFELDVVTLLETDLVGRCVESLRDSSCLRMPCACCNLESDQGELLRDKGNYQVSMVTLRDKGRPLRDANTT